MINYKLLTPGPLTTTDTVKREMMADHCTWDDDYKQIPQKIRAKLLELAHVSEKDYTVVLMQGSGSFGVESILTSAVGEDDTLLIIANGAYGERMADIAEHAILNYLMYRVEYDRIPSADEVARLLSQHPEITHVAMVHSETTSGILNDIASVTNVVKSAGKTMIVFRVFPASRLSSVGVTVWLHVRGKHEVSPWISTTSGKQWKKTANGDSLPRPTPYSHLQKHWRNWTKREGSRRAPNATMTTTAF